VLFGFALLRTSVVENLNFRRVEDTQSPSCSLQGYVEKVELGRWA
jgi:hypothetical protein